MLFNRHYPSLDFLRSVAIALVLLLHFHLKFYPLPRGGMVRGLAAWGWNGVGLFFALSGFLIGGQIIEALQLRSFSFRVFYIKRFWRIFPPYYASLMAVAAFTWAGLATPLGTRDETIRTIVYHALYIQNYVHLKSPRLPLYWSLAVEEQFYLLAPLLLYLLWRYLRRALAPVLSGLILLAIGTRFALYGPGTDWLLDIRWPFHTRFDALLFGVLAAYVFIRYNERLRRLGPLARLAMYGLSLAAIGATLVFGGDYNTYFNTCWEFTLTGFGFALLTLSLALSSFDSRIRPCLRGFFALTARYSYTMYLYHLMLIYPVGLVVIRAHRYLGLGPGPWGFVLSFALYFAVVLGVSGLIYQVVDRPAMNHRRRVLEGRGRPAASPG